MASGLPQSVLDMAERTPVEDILLAVLAEKIPDVACGTLIKGVNQPFPYILLRRGIILGDDTGDERFIDRAPVTFHVFCQDDGPAGVSGDIDASILSEAIRVVMRDAGREKKVYAGLGHITSVQMTSSPRRAPDWATSSGPVQYADLPQGTWRYETQFTVAVRTPTDRTHNRLP